MTRAEIRVYARRWLAEQVAADSFWDDATLNDFLNRAYEQIVSMAELLQCNSEGGVTFVAGEVHNEYVMPADILRILSIRYRGKKLIDKTVEELDLEDSDWITRVADAGTNPVKWAPAGQTFYLVPAPSETASGVLLMRCIQTPAPLTGDTQSPQVPTGYHELIAIGTAVRALRSDRTAPENRQAIVDGERLIEGGIAWAASQHRRQAPRRGKLVDVRDFYSSQWRP